VFVSKYGKSYDPSDGSEQHCDEAPRRAQSIGQAAGQRWEDDGGPLNDMPRQRPSDEFTSKPSWSVLSLRDLNDAIRRAKRIDDPVKLQQEFDRAERRAIKAVAAYKERSAAGARAKHDRYGNAWEHTLM